MGVFMRRRRNWATRAFPRRHPVARPPLFAPNFTLEPGFLCPARPAEVSLSRPSQASRLPCPTQKVTRPPGWRIESHTPSDEPAFCICTWHHSRHLRPGNKYEGCLSKIGFLQGCYIITPHCDAYLVHRGGYLYISNVYPEISFSQHKNHKVNWFDRLWKKYDQVSSTHICITVRMINFNCTRFLGA